MIEATIVLRSGETITKYFSVLPRIGEYIELKVSQFGITRCKVQLVVHTPSDNPHTTSSIEIRL